MAYVESTTGYGGHRDGFDDELGEDGPAMVVEEEAPVGDRGFMRGSAFDGPGYDAPPAVYEDEVEGGGMRGGGYGGRRPVAARPPPPTPAMYGEPAEPGSDLGTGLMDNGIRGTPDYGTGYGRSDGTTAGTGYSSGYGESKEDREEMDDERKHKRIAEGVAAAAVGYGLYEHHQKSQAEDKLEELGYDSDGNKKKEHHLFG